MADEVQTIKSAEERKKQRDLKKFGKQIQVEKLKERQLKKTEGLEKIKALKKSTVVYYHIHLCWRPRTFTVVILPQQNGRTMN